MEKLDRGLSGKIILVGHEQDYILCTPDMMNIPFLTKPFSLDHFGEVVRKACAA